VRVTVRLFAQLREIAGPSPVVSVPAGSTVGEVWEAVAALHPTLREFSKAISCAVNADFAPMTAPVREGDEVAFLPPVSGG